jgi:hypothetical protein
MGNAGSLTKSVNIDRDGRQQWTSELRIKLLVPRLLLGHELSKPPAFFAEWMVNKQEPLFFSTVYCPGFCVSTLLD